MFDISIEDLRAVYEQLKGKYDLIWTTTAVLDEGFTADFPIIVGKANGLIIELFEDCGDFVLDVIDETHTKGTHWHPNDVESAVDDIIEFMEGKSFYDLHLFRQQ